MLKKIGKRWIIFGLLSLVSIVITLVKVGIGNQFWILLVIWIIFFIIFRMKWIFNFMYIIITFSVIFLLTIIISFSRNSNNEISNNSENTSITNDKAEGNCSKRVEYTGLFSGTYTFTYPECYGISESPDAPDGLAGHAVWIGNSKNTAETDHLLFNAYDKEIALPDCTTPGITDEKGDYSEKTTILGFDGCKQTATKIASDGKKYLFLSYDFMGPKGTVMIIIRAENQKDLAMYEKIAKGMKLK